MIERQNPLCVISVDSVDGVHSIQTNSGWIENPYGESFVIVPDEMVKDIMATHGYCDIVINEGKVVSFTAKEKTEVKLDETTET